MKQYNIFFNINLYFNLILKKFNIKLSHKFSFFSIIIYFKEKFKRKIIIFVHIMQKYNHFIYIYI